MHYKVTTIFPTKIPSCNCIHESLRTGTEIQIDWFYISGHLSYLVFLSLSQGWLLNTIIKGKFIQRWSTILPISIKPPLLIPTHWTQKKRTWHTMLEMQILAALLVHFLHTCIRSFLSSSMCLCVASCSILTSVFMGTLIFTRNFLLKWN